MNPAAVLGHAGVARAGWTVTRSSSASRCRAPTPRRRAWCRSSSQLVPAGDGDAAAVLTTLVDVTGRREVEAALTRSEMQFRVAMENAPIGMALVDVDWRIVEANAAFAELLGTSVGALRGLPHGGPQHPGGSARRAPRGRPPARRRPAPVLPGEAVPASRRPPGLGRARRRARAHPDRRARPLRRPGPRLDGVAAAGGDAHAPRDARPADRAGQPHPAPGGPAVRARAARRGRPGRGAGV